MGLKRLWREKRLCLPGALKALKQEKNSFRTFLRSLHRKKWVVYAKPPFGGPAHVLQYLARYTHRVAISNHRIVNFAEGKVSFRWKDYAHSSQQRVMTLDADEFLRRFLATSSAATLSVRIRSFGFLANRPTLRHRWRCAANCSPLPKCPCLRRKLVRHWHGAVSPLPEARWSSWNGSPQPNWRSSLTVPS